MKTLTYMVLGSGDPLPKTMALDEDYDTYRPKKGIAYHFLITIVDCENKWLWKIAMLVYETMLPRDCLFNPMESKNREQFRQFLPDEYRDRDCAIVDIQHIDSVVIIEPLEIQANVT